MRWGPALIVIAALAACGGGAPNPYPESAHRQFVAGCGGGDVCVCTWDAITRKLTYEEYQDAMTRFRERGLMDTRITHARTQCVEHHHA